MNYGKYTVIMDQDKMELSIYERVEGIQEAKTISKEKFKTRAEMVSRMEVFTQNHATSPITFLGVGV